ncbi:hypothetical protein DFH09DRAFT_1094859 [Mycena vulgaris]|nr:hypothetical protein DFH09DRAFT_1094859 [Mycena vulgaris]
MPYYQSLEMSWDLVLTRWEEFSQIWQKLGGSVKERKVRVLFTVYVGLRIAGTGILFAAGPHRPSKFTSAIKIDLPATSIQIKKSPCKEKGSKRKSIVIAEERKTEKRISRTPRSSTRG